MPKKTNSNHPLATIRKIISKRFPMTQKTLASMISWNKATLYRVEKGEIPMSKKLAKDLDSVLGTFFLNHLEKNSDVFSYKVCEEDVILRFFSIYQKTDPEFEEKAVQAHKNPPSVYFQKGSRLLDFKSPIENHNETSKEIENYTRDKMYQIADEFKKFLLSKGVTPESAEANKYLFFAIIFVDAPTKAMEMMIRSSYLSCENVKIGQMFEDYFLEWINKTSLQLGINKDIKFIKPDITLSKNQTKISDFQEKMV